MESMRSNAAWVETSVKREDFLRFQVGVLRKHVWFMNQSMKIVLALNNLIREGTVQTGVLELFVL